MFGPLLFALIAVGLVGLAKTDKATSSSSPTPSPPSGPTPGPAIPGTTPLTCSSAVAGLPEPLKTNVTTALMYGTDPAKLEEAAKALDQVAAAHPGLGAYAATASMCLRARASELAAKAPPTAPAPMPSVPSVPGVSPPALPPIPELPGTPTYSAAFEPAPLDLTLANDGMNRGYRK